MQSPPIKLATNKPSAAGAARFAVVIASLWVIAGCAGQPPAPPQVVADPQPEPVIVKTICEPEIDLVTEAAKRKLALANEWHREGRYQAAFEAYESGLAEHASLLADAYALWGIVAMRLDRDNPDYDRDAARTAAYVLQQRADAALAGEAKNEAQLLLFSTKIMIDADVSKDGVVVENRKLREELAQREEAIKRLKELTLGP